MPRQFSSANLDVRVVRATDSNHIYCAPASASGVASTRHQFPAPTGAGLRLQCSTKRRRRKGVYAVHVTAEYTCLSARPVSPVSRCVEKPALRRELLDAAAAPECHSLLNDGG